MFPRRRADQIEVYWMICHSDVNDELCKDSARTTLCPLHYHYGTLNEQDHKVYESVHLRYKC
jgi:hypothetical protein